MKTSLFQITTDDGFKLSLNRYKRAPKSNSKDTNEHAIAQNLRSGAVANVLSQIVTHAHRTSLVTSRPARRKHKTGRAARTSAPTTPASVERRGAVRNAQSTDPDAPPESHVPWAASRRCGRRGLAAGHEHTASGATERGRRCSERNSLRAQAPRPPPPRTARAATTHQNDQFIFRSCWSPQPQSASVGRSFQSET
ncbi:unnamed protein product [Leptosia nina]|uniref:Uncharacterized protein n=1 Tax=Leptosia nina TaxID=320188 RepID=A0AAV1ISC1_9NEOP